MCSVVPWIYQQVKSIWKWLESSDMQNYFMVFFSKSELSKLSMDMDSSNIKIFNENKWETVRERQNIYLNRNQFSSVTQSCQTLCNLMDCSMPGFPVHHHLPKFAQTHVHQVGDDIQPSHYLLSTSPPASIFSSIRVFSFFFFFFFSSSGSFPMSQFFASGGQSNDASATASVLPMNIQDWFPFGWTGWISSQSKGLSRVFSNTTVQKHQFFGTRLSLELKSYIHTQLLEKT